MRPRCPECGAFLINETLDQHVKRPEHRTLKLAKERYETSGR